MKNFKVNTEKTSRSLKNRTREWMQNLDEGTEASFKTCLIIAGVVICLVVGLILIVVLTAVGD